jgi:hypothetical protein
LTTVEFLICILFVVEWILHFIYAVIAMRMLTAMYVMASCEFDCGLSITHVSHWQLDLFVIVLIILFRMVDEWYIIIMSLYCVTCFISIPEGKLLDLWNKNKCKCKCKQICKEIWSYPFWVKFQVKCLYHCFLHVKSGLFLVCLIILLQLLGSSSIKW